MNILPVVFAVLLAASPAARAEDAAEPSAADPGAAPKPEPAQQISPSLRASLDALGRRPQPDGSWLRLKDGASIPRALLGKAGYDYDAAGDLIYLKSGDKVDYARLPAIAKGLDAFALAGRDDPEKAGRDLLAWGLPPAYDGLHLVNPDGSATYYGRMIHSQLLADSRDPARALRGLSGKRLAQSLSSLTEAHEQAFKWAAPEVAQSDVARARSLLVAPAREGEAALDLTPRPSAAAVLEAARSRASPDALKSQESYVAWATGDLMRTRYHSDKSLDAAAPPDPGRPEPQAPPSPLVLPRLLDALETLNGKPLTDAQRESFVKSFPMGELAWRMQAPDLWKMGYTGKGVKVAVIDGGVGSNRELDDALSSSRNLTLQHGTSASGHGTCVAGIIHCLAPEAELRSYRAVEDGNPRLETGDVDHAPRIKDAIRQALADGNHVINISLVAKNSRYGDLSRFIDEHAGSAIFVASAGNDGGKGLRSPGNARSAFTAGALDVDERMSPFSSYGETFDPLSLSYAMKTILMAPGENIPSLRDGGGHTDFNGTSAAAPALTGSIAQLLPAVWGLGYANPVKAGDKLRELLMATGSAIPDRELPPDAPSDQRFIIVRPRDAYNKLAAKKNDEGPEE